MYINEYGLWLAFPILNPSDLSYQAWDFYDTLEEIEEEQPNYEDDFVVFYHGTSFGELQFDWIDGKIDRDCVHWYTKSIYISTKEIKKQQVQQTFDRVKETLEKQFNCKIYKS